MERHLTWYSRETPKQRGPRAHIVRRTLNPELLLPRPVRLLV